MDHSAGIEQTEDMKRFLWDNHFAAIASDQPALEVRPILFLALSLSPYRESVLILLSLTQRWPPPEGVTHLHSTLLGYVTPTLSLPQLCSPRQSVRRYSRKMYSMWGMPIGEFFDLEALSKHCAETGRYTFFFSSWPLNV